MSNGRRCLFSILVAVLLAAAVYASLRPTEYPPHHPDDVAPGLVGAGERSSKWPKVRAAYMRGNPVCEACGATCDLEVHHIAIFSEEPERELDPTNLITLCRSDHLKLGHKCEDGHTNWKCGNPNVRDEAARELMRRYGPK